ncbi:D-alanyl-D-alanine carboxypeptidase [Oceanobacillus profundus]|uniref:D-alanyl-D-alanine carboxypeptidase family protein n=1 Tax=Oceanobacillus profundus TaxID=372463 RepID=UPI00203F5E4F|nr:D-alanyl-D-alanine carboxypeptidase family protein [Oceanobacillus profundus]MBR3120738.1 D-alanyl-D-alanine carboxypeptidase [Oceanobacillus sp.]MCM3396584.1 D-alanyl-D-alanine carboxypeptidase [Oceanobacillus profundus]
MRFLILILILLVVQLGFPITGQATPVVSANNAILIEQSTGRVLYEKKAHEEASIASITKIMTAIIAIESGKMDEMATASRSAIYTEGSSIYLEQGEEMKLEDLVYGLMLRSGNDAAIAIAEHVGGSEKGFVYMMNEKAKWLGMTNTHFDNPHGLDSETHYSTAYDMAILTRYAMENNTFQEISGSENYISENRSYSWKNKNRLLTQFYEYCTGGKTGYTKQTGRTLVTTAEKDGMKLIAVTLDAPDDWNDHISMFEWGYENYQMEPLSDEGPIKYRLNETNLTVNGFVEDEVSYPLSVEEIEVLTSSTFLLSNYLTTDEEIIGKTVFYLDDEQLMETHIFQNRLEPNDHDFKQTFTSILIQIIGLK